MKLIQQDGQATKGGLFSCIQRKYRKGVESGRRPPPIPKERRCCLLQVVVVVAFLSWAGHASFPLLPHDEV